MPRLRTINSALLAFILLFGCGRKPSEWVYISSSPDSQYTTSVRSHGSDYADRPFDIRVQSKRAPYHENFILSASQCSNVRILPKRDFIYFFYDELVLTGFSSFQFDRSLPRPIMCDLKLKTCQDMLESAFKANEAISPICSHD